jgi:hypothetical protein
MPCVLHVELPEGGRALSERLSIQPYKLIERGEPMRGRPGKTYESDFLAFDVSEAEFDQLPQQFSDATEFLREHEADVRVLTEAGKANLDFGYSPRRESPDFTPLVQVDRLPQQLIRLAAALDVEIELSLYLGWDEDEEVEPGHRAG